MKITAVEPLGISTQKEEELNTLFRSKGFDFQLYRDRTEEATELVKRMQNAQIVMLSNIPLSGEMLSQCPDLQMICVAFTGIDHIDTAFCQNHNIKITNAVGYAKDAVAELVIAMIINLLRDIPTLEKHLRQGGTRGQFLGNQLSGKTVGIVGMGNIGKHLAKLLQCFGCKIIAYSRRIDDNLAQQGVEYQPLDILLKRSDIVSLHLPLTEETFHLLDKNRLKLLQPHALLINTARGNIVDTQALADCLQQNRIAGAGWDVFETEPPLPPQHPLLTAPHCLLSPHIGYATKEAFEKRIEIVVKNIMEFIDNKQIIK